MLLDHAFKNGKDVYLYISRSVVDSPLASTKKRVLDQTSPFDLVEPNCTLKELEDGLVMSTFESCAFGNASFPSIIPTTQERFPDGRLLCNGTDACSGGSGVLEFSNSSDYLDCRGCLWIALNQHFAYIHIYICFFSSVLTALYYVEGVFVITKYNKKHGAPVTFSFFFLLHRHQGRFLQQL